MSVYPSIFIIIRTEVQATSPTKDLQLGTPSTSEHCEEKNINKYKCGQK
jgi:hypothetical protein